MFILLGLLIGFLAAIPLGPVNVFAVSQTLKRDFLHGFLAGLTASFLDILYCLVALLGISQIIPNLARYMIPTKIVAALLLAAISFRLIRQSGAFPERKNQEKFSSSYPRPVIGAFLLYISNPTIYAFWLAVASAVTAHGWIPGKNGWSPVAFALACGLGSLSWYFSLIKYTSRNRDRFKPETFRKILLGTAVVLCGFALYTIGSIFF